MRAFEPARQQLRRGVAQPSYAVWPGFSDAVPILADRLAESDGSEVVELLFCTEFLEEPNALASRVRTQNSHAWATSRHTWGNAYVVLVVSTDPDFYDEPGSDPNRATLTFDPESDAALLLALLDHDLISLIPSKLRPTGPRGWVAQPDSSSQPLILPYKSETLAAAIEMASSEARPNLGPRRAPPGELPEQAVLVRAAEQLGGWIAAEENDDLAESAYMFERFCRLLGDFSAAIFVLDLTSRWLASYVEIYNPPDLADPKLSAILVGEANVASRYTFSAQERTQIRNVIRILLDSDQRIEADRLLSKYHPRDLVQWGLKVMQGGAMVLAENSSNPDSGLTPLLTGYFGSEGLRRR